jgi:hypothetical protein
MQVTHRRACSAVYSRSRKTWKPNTSTQEKENRKIANDAAERWVGNHVKIHGGRLVATGVDAVSKTAVHIDYDGYLDPADKRTRVSGRKLVTLEELRRPELITTGQFQGLMYKK